MDSGCGGTVNIVSSGGGCELFEVSTLGICGALQLALEIRRDTELTIESETQNIH